MPAQKQEKPARLLACVPGGHTSAPQLTPEDVAMLLRSQDKPMLLDVRERDEFADGKIAGSFNIPIGTILAGVLDRQLPREKLIITICEHGVRANRAASELSSRGFVVAVLAGGMEAWRRHARDKRHG
jgi:adenylyltransferase/sulfurtransferase